jgi:ligand-binding SRPBCC domain-containing protein
VQRGREARNQVDFLAVFAVSFALWYLWPATFYVMSRHFESEQWVPAPVERVFAFFADPHNLPRIMPPALGTKLVKLSLVPPRFPAGQVPLGTLRMAGAGTEMTVAVRVIPYLPVHERWLVRITEFSLNEYFHDVQRQGPFRRWEHTHSFEPMMQDGAAGTLLRDEVEYDVGFGMIGRALESAVFQNVFRATFNYRKRAIGEIFRAPAAVIARA